MDLVSVIIPVYNVEKYLERCVSSVMNQTYTNIEIILVDDGSPDSSGKICDDLAAKDKRIKVIHKENAGAGFARNAGLDIATGKYVTFVDSDDWLDLSQVENLHRLISDNEADAVIGSHSIVDTDGNKTERPLYFQPGVYEGTDKIIDEIILPLIGPHPDFPNDIIVASSTCMNMYRMDLIKNNNLRFSSERVAVAEDLYFNLDFFRVSEKIVASNEYGYYYFENKESISRKYKPERFVRTLNFYNKLTEVIKEFNLTDRADYRAERSFLMKVRVGLRHVVMSDLKRKEKIKEIKMMLNNEVVHRVLCNYPINKYIPSMRTLVKLMHKQNARGVYFLIWFRESAKNNKLLSKLLYSVGIGR